MSQTPPHISTTPEVGSPSLQYLNAEEDAHIARVLQIMAEANEAMVIPVEPSSSQAEDYEEFNPCPPSSHSGSPSSNQSYLDVSPFPTAPEEVFSQSEAGNTPWGEAPKHPGTGWNSYWPGITVTSSQERLRLWTGVSSKTGLWH
jgi:hypothetical protein